MGYGHMMLSCITTAVQPESAGYRVATYAMAPAFTSKVPRQLHPAGISASQASYTASVSANPSPIPQADSSADCPAYGAKSETGRRSTQEDSSSAHPNLCNLGLPTKIDDPRDNLPQHVSKDAGYLMATLRPGCSVTAQPVDSETQPVHYFGVFDGHAGAHVSQHCAKRLHHHLRSALVGVIGSPGTPAAGEPGTASSTNSFLSSSYSAPVSPHGSTTSSTGASKLFMPEDPSAWPSKLVPGAGEGSAKPSSLHAQVESSLMAAFLATDHELCLGNTDVSLMGSTAVVALVARTHIWVANCGDSRAVLVRNGIAVPLSHDQKADREDEVARIQRAGGQVINNRGARVQGVLAMSRAIGDHALRPYVVADPEVAWVARRPGDNLLLLASDGLWDVMSSQEASLLALRCLKSAHSKGADNFTAARIASKVLTKRAVELGSRDNVTVLVVDLTEP